MASIFTDILSDLQDILSDIFLTKLNSKILDVGEKNNCKIKMGRNRRRSSEE